MASAYLAHMGDLSPMLSLFGWWFVPGYVAALVLSIFYRVFPTRRPLVPPSPPSSSDGKPVFNPLHELQKLEYDRRSRHHRAIAHGLVICIYLGYTLIGAYCKQSGQNYYSILGIQSNVLALNSTNLSVPVDLHSIRNQMIQGDLLDEAGLKSHWRKMARTFHPDKLSPPSNLKTQLDVTLWKNGVEAKFIEMREAYETLSDSTKLWAYDRFGPVILDWKNCITMREYLIEGVKNSAPFYVLSSSSLLFIGGLKKSDTGTYWRWSILVFVVALESMILTSTSLTRVSFVLSLIFPNRAPFEHIELLRKLFIASSCVATQLTGIMYQDPESARKKISVDKELEPIFGLIEQIKEYSSLANVEVVKLMFNDLHPIIRSPVENESCEESQCISSVTPDLQNKKVQKAVLQVKSKMLDTFVDLKLQSDPQGQAAWIEAVQKSESSY